MTNHAPKIGELFDAWNLWRKPFLTRRTWHSTESLREVTDAELERFFAEHDRRVAERAWAEGALWAAVECGAIKNAHEKWLASGDNPYEIVEEEV